MRPSRPLSGWLTVARADERQPEVAILTRPSASHDILGLEMRCPVAA